MKRTTRLKPISKKRRTRKGKVTGTVRLTGKDMERLRRKAYITASGVCQLMISPRCWKWASWEHGHMAHIQSKGSGGGDTIDNVRWSCRECHMYEHNGGKPVPSKETA